MGPRPIGEDTMTAAAGDDDAGNPAAGNLTSPRPALPPPMPVSKN
jgi:hypothetical protein